MGTEIDYLENMYKRQQDLKIKREVSLKYMDDVDHKFQNNIHSVYMQIKPTKREVFPANFSLRSQNSTHAS